MLSMLTGQLPERLPYLTRLLEVGDYQVLAVDEAGRVVSKGADLSVGLVFGRCLNEPCALLGKAPWRRDIMLEDGTSIRVEMTELDDDAYGCLPLDGHTAAGAPILRDPPTL
jgi:hypothetical protein